MSQLGQYFTIDHTLQQKVSDLIKNTPDIILEPSVGKGHLLTSIIKDHKPEKIICYEIDKLLKPIVDETYMDSKNLVIYYEDFLTAKIKYLFPTIIGNPPYVKTTRGNLYIDFIDKCYKLLTDTGEMIMIVPSDFLKSTVGTNIRNKLLEHGSITDIYHPNDEHLFANASIDIIIFRYQKGVKTNIVSYNDNVMQLCNNGIITLEETNTDNDTGNDTDTDIIGDNLVLSDIFEIYVGIVSGAEDVFKVPFGNIKVINSENSIDNYILLESFPSKSKKINNHLLSNKERLLSRRIRKFNDTNWYQWGALRNISKVTSNRGKNCIYIKTITRSNIVAFTSVVDYFGGSLLMILPRDNLEYTVSLDDFVEYFNSINFKKNYIQSGRFKIGHRQLSLAKVSLQ